MANYKENTFEQVIDTISNERERRINALKSADSRAIQLWELMYENYSKDLKPTLNFAYNFANEIKYKHPGVSSDVYFSHPLRVASFSGILSEYKHIDYPILGLLHNVLEVSEVSTDNLKKLFGHSISEQIEVLTVNRSCQWDKIYKEEYYYAINAQPHSCRAVKVIDKFDNLFSLHLNPDKKTKMKYLDEIDEYIVPMAEKDLTPISNYLNDLIEDCKKTSFI
jgi:(p)ppGpp synthase/HD superfamily hydrolase